MSPLNNIKKLVRYTYRGNTEHIKGTKNFWMGVKYIHILLTSDRGGRYAPSDKYLILPHFFLFIPLIIFSTFEILTLRGLEFFSLEYSGKSSSKFPGGLFGGRGGRPFKMSENGCSFKMSLINTWDWL